MTGNFLLEGRILHAELNAEFCLCIFKELSHAGARVCVHVYVCALCACAISAPISPGTEGRLNGPACEVPRSYLCSRHTSSLLMHSPQIESGIDRKSCLLLYARVTTWFPLLHPPRRRWSPTRNCGKKVDVEFSNLTIFLRKMSLPSSSQTRYFNRVNIEIILPSVREWNWITPVLRATPHFISYHPSCSCIYV